MGHIWLGRFKLHKSKAIARFEDGMVFRPEGETTFLTAIGRYARGYVWWGMDESWESFADARYGQGCLWEGQRKRPDCLIGCYSEGYFWWSSQIEEPEKALLRYEGDEAGAAASVYLVLFSPFERFGLIQA